jgi:hypothetical protein
MGARTGLSQDKYCGGTQFSSAQHDADFACPSFINDNMNHGLHGGACQSNKLPWGVTPACLGPPNYAGFRIGYTRRAEGPS